MKKQIFSIIMVSSCLVSIAQSQIDSTKTIKLDEVVVTSLKETSPRQTPLSSSTLTMTDLNKSQVNSIKNLSALVPNFYIPEYGSAMSSAVYIRGIGTRNSGQSMGLYVDNVPYFEKSTFDFEFYDIQQLEVLRGAQGTLYGRNSEGGIVNIYTLSPLTYQGTKVSITAGNYGLWNLKAGHYAKFNNKLGVSVSGYYNKEDGFFSNDYTQKSADDKSSAGGRAKLEWAINPQWKAQYLINFDYVNQSAFPYGAYDETTGKVANPNFNDESSYNRRTLNNSLLLQYRTDKLLLSSVSSHQYYDDKMLIDQDFSVLPMFTLSQNQIQHAINEEITIKSITKNNYQWSFGATGFLQAIDMDAPVTFKSEFLKSIQYGFDAAAQANPRMPKITITDEEMIVPGLFNFNSMGGALFHQSSINNLGIDGLSLTAGLRVDYEKSDLDYDTYTALNASIKPGPTTIPLVFTSDTLKGSLSFHFSELLPKVALKYEWSNRQFVYANVSRGYKAGGYNVQMLADLIESSLNSATRSTNGKSTLPKPNVGKAISYNPEYSWNYEVGGQCITFDNRLKTTASIYFLTVNDMQLTQFVPSGNGRMISNAGGVQSKGLELSAYANLGRGFSASVNYGYANASFTNYVDTLKSYGSRGEIVTTPVDYKGKFVPYAPQNTLSVAALYEHSFHKAFINHIMASVQYNGIGKIYWNEANDLSQDFYSMLNAKLAVTKASFGLEIWAKNLMDTQYNAFYFNSSGNKFFQLGKPMQIGLTLKMEL
jgi:outer membrane receptor protein involved in Fe transport